MCVDRTITPGLLMASDYVKTVQVETENSNGQASRARIALRQEASADYDDEEDVDLLYDQNLKDIPQVYTVAGNAILSVEAQNRYGQASQAGLRWSSVLLRLRKMQRPWPRRAADFQERRRFLL